MPEPVSDAYGLPTAAVEAAAWELALELNHTTLGAGKAAPNTVRITRRVLTAAAPHIAAQATTDLRAGIEALRDEWRTMGGHVYHRASAALDALLRGA